LIGVFTDVRKLNRPVVVHVNTQKGKGYGYAEDDPGSYHGVGSFSVDGGIKFAGLNIKNKFFTESFSDIITSAAQNDKKIVAITAAMKTGTGLSAFAKNFPERFYDVGIAEEHAVTFAAGLAAQGLKPVVAVYSTFIQRAVDQVIHDTALQKLPVIFALDRAGFVGADGETHQGLFDIPIFRSVPNMTILAPASENEMKLMLLWALEKTEIPSGPVIIRYPKAYCPQETECFSLPIKTGCGVWVEKSGNAQVCLVFTGSLYIQALEAAAILKEKNINTDLYNLRFIKPVDEDNLVSILNEYKLVCFIEEGMSDGGFGEYAVTLAGRKNCKAKTLVLAAQSKFLEEDRALGTREELLSLNNLDSKNIANTVLAKT
jgi:1-deoxy-D-xylulose-5-phosphate synthase